MKLTSFLLVLTASFLPVDVHAQQAFGNGSFEESSLNPGTGYVLAPEGSNAITGWRVTKGNVHYVADAYWRAADGVRSIDLNGNTAGALSQTIQTKKGIWYRLTFNYAGNPDGGPAVKDMHAIVVGINGVRYAVDFKFDITGKSRSNMGWEENWFTFIADDSSTIIFDSQISGEYGPAIDNVRVEIEGSQDRIVSILGAEAFIGDPVAVPIQLQSKGDENALSFTVAYDNNVLLNPTVSLGAGASGGTMFLNMNTPGRIGALISLLPGNTFSAGLQEILVMKFSEVNAPSDGSSSTSLSFTDDPVMRQVANAAAEELGASWVGGEVILKEPGYEGDVSPRPDGDQNVSVADGVLIGRFVAGLETFTTGANEFQRADCAPRSSLGDGQVNLLDYVQDWRYIAKLDPLTRVGGPTEPAGGAGYAVRPHITSAQKVEGAHAVILREHAVSPGEVVFPVYLVAQGDEAAVSFSVAYDSTLMGSPRAELGSEASGSFLITNDKAGAGKFGVVLAAPIGSSYGTGLREVVRLTFTGLSVSASSTLSFTDDPVQRELADTLANVLEAEWRLEKTTAINTPVKMPKTFSLAQNFPNPFNPSTEIRFDLPKDAHVTLAVCNIAGQRVATLVNDRLPAGTHSIIWKAENMPSGIYFYRLQASEFAQTRKMVLAR